MGKFVPKASEVEAAQFNINMAKKEWQLTSVVDGGRTIIKAMVPGLGLVGDGDYIVKDGKDASVVSQDDFLALYEPKAKK